MLTLRAAATLLADATSLPALRPIARALGFVRAPLPVLAGAGHGTDGVPGSLPIASLVSDAELIPGPGELRLLAAILPGAPGGSGQAECEVASTAQSSAREQTRRLCAMLAREVPASHWCALTLDHARRTLCIATAGAHREGIRVAALVVERERVMDSDADTLRALAGVSERHGILRHARFTDILRREALSTRFYRALERMVASLAGSASGAASAQERHSLALLCTSRCLFLSFLEAKGWLDGDRNFMLHHMASSLESGGHLHRRLLRPLFFGTLNTPFARRAAAARAFGRVPFLNGGLFSPTPLERKCPLTFGDDALVALVGDLLDRYRFTAREDSATWSEAAVDPEMLGRAFESMMGEAERRGSGAYYTPPALVNDVVHDALHGALPALPDGTLAAADWHQPGDGTRLEAQLGAHGRRALLEQVRALRVLDPACGSGAFLVRVLEQLSFLQHACGDTRRIDDVRRDVLTRSIFGVDRNPMATWLCELRLWLSVVIESEERDPLRVVPLPNLDHHIRVGDSLAGGDFTFSPAAGRQLATLRERYARATGGRKQSLDAAVEREERKRALAELKRRITVATHARRELVSALRQRDLFGHRVSRTSADRQRLRDERRRVRALQMERRALELGGALPFRFAAQFADAAACGGFAIIVGNPPWIRPHAVPAAERIRLRSEFRTLRQAAWLTGARRAGASAAFAAQADLAAAFIERSVRLLSPGGTLAMLVPAKLWRALAGGGVRELLLGETRIRRLHDWSDAPAMFDAAVYPSLIVAERSASTPAVPADVRVAVVRGETTRAFRVPSQRLPLGDEPSAPWVLLPAQVRDAFERLRRSGPALGDSPLGRPTLGVKCGCNAAFLVHASLEGDAEHCGRDEVLVRVTAGARQGMVERSLLRPALRGESLRGHGAPRRERDIATPGHIIWTHGIDGEPLHQLPAAAARWLGARRAQLESRTDARRKRRWWSLFRTEAARHDCPRLVWADIGKRLHTTVLPSGDPTVPLNSCYVLRARREDDAWALQALLAAPAVAAWLDTLAEPARGGFRRYLGWTVASVPIPTDWSAACARLAPLGKRLGHRCPPSDRELMSATAAAYGIPEDALRPLVEWLAR